MYEICRGIEQEPVSARQLAKSIGCSKNFPGKTCLDTKEKVTDCWSFGIQSFIKISLNYCYFQFDQSDFQSTLFLVHL